MTVHLQRAHITTSMHKEEPFQSHCVLSGPHLCVNMCDKRTPPIMVYPLKPPKTDANHSKYVSYRLNDEQTFPSLCKYRI